MLNSFCKVKFDSWPGFEPGSDDKEVQTFAIKIATITFSINLSTEWKNVWNLRNIQITQTIKNDEHLEKMTINTWERKENVENEE